MSPLLSCMKLERVYTHLYSAVLESKPRSDKQNRLPVIHVSVDIRGDSADAFTMALLVRAINGPLLLVTPNVSLSIDQR